MATCCEKCRSGFTQSPLPDLCKTCECHTVKATKDSGWEIEFEKQFPNLLDGQEPERRNSENPYIVRGQIKDFIRSLLSSQKSALSEKIDGLVIDGLIIDTNGFTESQNRRAYYDRGFNYALEEVKQLLHE